MTASIIVPVHNRKELIITCLRALQAQDHPDLEIIIVDDGSDDGTWEALHAQANDPRIVLLRLSVKSGPAAARNAGIAKSRGEFIALTDSDCIPDQDWLWALIAPFKNDPQIMITTGRIVEDIPKTYWERVNKGGNFIAKTDGYVQQAIGCNMAIRRNFLQDHIFDANLPQAASEDLDLALQCLKDHGRIYYTSQARVIHQHRQDVRNTLKQSFRYGYYNTRVRLMRRHFPYLNIGTWLILFAFFSCALPGPYRMLCPILLILFLGIILHLTVRNNDRTVPEMLWVFPGMLLKGLADCLGNIAGVIGTLRGKTKR